MDIAIIRRKYGSLAASLTERGRRLWAAAEAEALGRGGMALVQQATGISRSTIARGMREIEDGEEIESGRIRRPGAGRKRKVDLDPRLLVDLEAMVEPTVSGAPQSKVRWTSKSTRTLARALGAMGHEVSHVLVGQMLRGLGYSLQGNSKSKEGRNHPDRNAQFERIDRQTKSHQRRGQPVISVDTKKKELVGDFKNGGREWRPRGFPERVRVHDFLIPELGKAIPYGVYDLTSNAGWVSVGIDHDTASFAVRSIRRWWEKMGQPMYPKATSLMITADSGGSNSARSRLWKLELQQLADETGLVLDVCHYPPGTSKWNKIEHKMFSFITRNWRGTPLTSLATIVNLIAATSTTTGLRIRCELDRRKYPKGRKVTDEEMAGIDIHRHRFQGDWNYTVRPRQRRANRERK